MVSMLLPKPYDLRDATGCSDRFYRNLASLADRVSALLDCRARSLLDEYRSFAVETLAEVARSRDEYGVDLLTLGLLRCRYLPASRSTPRPAVVAARWLYRLRCRYPDLRHRIDPWRGALLGRYFVPAVRRCTGRLPRSAASLDRLLGWLGATGEFNEECLRLAGWRRYLRTIAPARAKQLMGLCDELFTVFRQDAMATLGTTTESLPGFLEHRASNHRFLENALLVSKTAPEYHLNMVAAELMNRGLRERFSRTSQRVVLVPGCLRWRSSSECEAVAHGLDIVCSGCEPRCQVSQLRQLGRREGFRVRIVPHSSTFSRWLERYQSERDTGLVPVACPLHLIAGGYEVRRLGLSAQCVLLDYCGCQKHWHPDGIPTATNTRQTVALVRLGRAPSRCPAGGPPGPRHAGLGGPGCRRQPTSRAP